MRSKDRPALFTAAMTVVMGANLLPIWWPTWPPMQDAIAWVELLDIAARLGDATTLYPATYTFTGHIEPNSLSLGLGRALYHLSGGAVDARIAVKLLASVYTAGTPLAVAALCLAFGRTPWLAVLAAPMVFGPMWAMGLLNFLVAVPFIILAVAIARRVVDEPGHAMTVLLALVLVVLWLCHALAWMVAAGLTAVVLAFMGRSWRPARRLWALIPSIALFVPWWWRKFVALEATSTGRTFGTDAGMGLGFRLPTHLGERVWADVVALFKDSSADEWTWAAIASAWFILVVAAARNRPVHKPASDAVPTWRRFARRNGPAVLAAIAAIGWLAMPVQMHNLHVIGERLALITVLLACAIPAMKRPAGWSGWLLGLIVAMAIAWPTHIAARSAAFEATAIGGLPGLIEKLPARSRLTRLDRVLYNDVFHTGTLWYLSNALNALHNGGITDDNFACTPYAALQYRPGAKPPAASAHRLYEGELRSFDYMVLRTKTEPAAALANPLLEKVDQSGVWWVFRIKKRR